MQGKRFPEAHEEDVERLGQENVDEGKDKGRWDGGTVVGGRELGAGSRKQGQGALNADGRALV